MFNANAGAELVVVLILLTTPPHVSHFSTLPSLLVSVLFIQKTLSILAVLLDLSLNNDRTSKNRFHFLSSRYSARFNPG